MLQRQRAPRSWEIYGQLRAVTRAEAKALRVDKEDDPTPEAQELATPNKKRQRQQTTVSQRLAQCGHGAVLMLRRIWGVGHASYRWLGQLPVRPGRLALAGKLGELPQVDIRTATRQIGDTSILDVFLPVPDGDVRMYCDRLRTMVAGLVTDSGSEDGQPGLILADIHEPPF